LKAIISCPQSSLKKILRFPRQPVTNLWDPPDYPTRVEIFPPRPSVGPTFVHIQPRFSKPPNNNQLLIALTPFHPGFKGDLRLYKVLDFAYGKLLHYDPTSFAKRGFSQPRWFHFVHITSVSKLQITSSCYLLNAFHPDLKGIEIANYILPQWFAFVHITSVIKAKNSKKLLFS